MTLAHKDSNSIALFQTRYNRENCKIGIVHLGYGAFHRAHQSIYVDDYMEMTGDLRWGIAAVNLRADDALNFTKSSAVKCGYLIKTTDVDGSVEMRKVRSHVKYCDWSSAPEVTEELLSSADVHLVTITVTESGYHLKGDGELDLSSREIMDEVSGEQAFTVYGFLANALARRMNSINQPISILCCDNIRSNGRMLERCFHSYLKASKQESLLEWVSKNAAFPCSMVDRITPHATTDLSKEVNELFGKADFDPIHAEHFMQWVLEDHFVGPAPDLNKVGVDIVQDVDPYEEAKIRILNGGHTALAYFGALAGHKTFDQVMSDPALRKYFDNFEELEVLPGLQITLPFDKKEYLQKISNRFCNSAIADQLERICMDGYSKMQLYIRPTLSSCFSQGILPTHCFEAIASWYVYAKRFKAGQAKIQYHEPCWEQLSPLLDDDTVSEFVSSHQLWGELPDAYSDFRPSLLAAIEKVENSWPA